MKRNRLKIKDLFFVALYGVRAEKVEQHLPQLGLVLESQQLLQYQEFQLQAGQISFQH